MAGDLGAAQGRKSDRLGPYETAVSASITVPAHDMTDTQVAMPAELFRVPVEDLCNIHQQDSLLGDPTERNARNGLGISTQGAIPALHSALAQHARTYHTQHVPCVLTHGKTAREHDHRYRHIPC